MLSSALVEYGSTQGILETRHLVCKVFCSSPFQFEYIITSFVVFSLTWLSKIDLSRESNV